MANVAFLRIKNNAQLLGLANSRVRLQLIVSLVTSVLIFGAPLYACLSDQKMVLEASHRLFRDAERLVRKFIRWALRAKGDLRTSALYIFGNCTSLQLLCQKQCWRFFHSLKQHPRAASDTVHAIQSCTTIPQCHWGASTIRWWPEVAAHYPTVANTQPLYKAFRHLVRYDISQSDRLQQLGLAQLLVDIAQYSFSGAPMDTPPDLYDTLLALVHPRHALLVVSEEAGQSKVQVHQWPSWLQQGSSRVVRQCIDLFFPPSDTQDTYGAQSAPSPAIGTCSLCTQPVSRCWQHHIFYECTLLHLCDSGAQWQAFVGLLQAGYQGLALYTCFPLFASMMPRLPGVVASVPA